MPARRSRTSLLDRRPARCTPCNDRERRRAASNTNVEPGAISTANCLHPSKRLMRALHACRSHRPPCWAIPGGALQVLHRICAVSMPEGRVVAAAAASVSQSSGAKVPGVSGAPARRDKRCHDESSPCELRQILLQCSTGSHAIAQTVICVVIKTTKRHKAPSGALVYGRSSSKRRCRATHGVCLPDKRAYER
jgi:hypothetical protein